MSRQSSITVTVRVRPFSTAESANLIASSDRLSFGTSSSLRNPGSGRQIRRVVKVLDGRVLVFDPPDETTATLSATNRRLSTSQQSLARLSRKSNNSAGFGRDLRYAFDRVFDETATQQQVYERTARPLLDNILDGFNATIFAYGATGCGKTHTISGTMQDPGLIYLTLKELFERMDHLRDEKIFDLRLSYLEIYNETIRDLLVSPTPNQAKPLNLREDADRRITVPGLTSLSPESLEEIIDIIMKGNANRTMSPTEANAASSRSHAVLQVTLIQKPRTAGINEDHTLATLSIIDLAGSERATATKLRGSRLFEGANINKSLLALGNCINALCDPHRRAHVPYRDSKLTRLLKFSLGGNCRTVMIVCVSPSSVHYEETHNTLKYANRAKNIKTEVLRNMISVDRHVSQYVKAIVELREQISELENRLAQIDLSSQSNGSDQDAVTQSFAHESKLAEARNLLRMTFEETLPLQNDTINKVEKVKHFDDSIRVLKYWLSCYERILPNSADERVFLVRSKLESLLTRRAEIIADIDPELVYQKFQRSVSHIINTYKQEGATMYADVLQDEVDLLKSIIENQVLDAQNKVDEFTPVLESLLRSSFKASSLLKEGGMQELFSILEKWLLGIGLGEKPNISVLSESYKLNSTSDDSRTINRDRVHSFPTQPLLNNNLPRMFFVKSPKKPVVFSKRSPKKRVRFDDSMSTSDSGASAYNSPIQTSKLKNMNFFNTMHMPSTPVHKRPENKNQIDVEINLTSPVSPMLEDKPEPGLLIKSPLEKKQEVNSESTQLDQLLAEDSSTDDVSLPHLDTIDLDGSPVPKVPDLNFSRANMDSPTSILNNEAIHNFDFSKPKTRQSLSSLTTLHLSNPANIIRKSLSMAENEEEKAT
ncbi:Kinesin-like protein [Schizosaccharomyces pombe]